MKSLLYRVPFVLVLSCSLLALSLQSAAAATNTSVHGYERQPAAIADETLMLPQVKQMTLTLEAPVRLDTFLSFAMAQFAAQGEPLEDVHWPTARLVFNDRAAEVEALRSRVLADLQAIARFQPELATPLLRQIQQWHLGAQPYGELSLERARVRNEANPLLPAGSYTLYLPTRAPRVYVYGLVASAGAVPFVAGQSVRGYLAKLQQRNQLLRDANRDYATLVRAAQLRPQVPWGPHNATQIEVQPGDLIWLGPQTPSVYGLLPVGPLGHALQRKSRKAAPQLEENLQQLLQHFVYDGAGSVVQSQRVQDANAVTRVLNHYSATGGWQADTLDSSLRSFSDTRRRVTTGNYGQAGLIQMPTARMSEPGDLTLSYNDMDIYRRFTVNLQLFEWLETSAFYVRVPNRLYSSVPSFSGTQIYTDKGFDVKVRLWEESYYLPEVSVGLRDFAGTGLFDGEYVVANKAWGPLDFTLGVGFGRLGTRDQFKNPFCHVADRFCNRPGGFSGSGGQFEYDQWFRGKTAMFGGVEYQTPWQPLRLKLEYESNNYSSDSAGIRIVPRTPWNVGLNYQLTDGVDVRLGYERGDTLSFGITFRTNFNYTQQARMSLPTPVVQTPRVESLAEVNWPRVRERVEEQLGYLGPHFYAETIALDQDVEVQENTRVSLYTYPWRQRAPQEKLDRTFRVLASELPSSVQEVAIVEQVYNQPLVSYAIDLPQYRAQIDYQFPDEKPADAWTRVTRSEVGKRPARDDAGWLENYGEYKGRPQFGWSPHIIQSLGAPERFYFYQVYLSGFGHWQFNPHWGVVGDVGVNVVNNYDRFNFTVDSLRNPLPRVRTLIREYSLQDAWINRTQLNYFNQLTPELYVLAYAGVLERMFSGVGGEVLYRPLDRSWAIGLDVNRVRQRDFSGGLGLLDYEVTTGHLALYYDLGRDFSFFDGSHLKLSFGQFLAGDRGVNIIYQRRFNSGMTVGAYASLTNVSSVDYGEGSFTKGFFVSIPYDLMFTRPSRHRGNFSWVPIYRDGGHMLDRRMQLHPMTEQRSPFYDR